MVTVTVVFVNGQALTFQAQEFDADLRHSKTDEPNYEVIPLPYKDAAGGDSHIHLKPTEVAGIFVTKAEPGSPSSRSIHVHNTRTKDK